jgi:hypothetical protein
VDAYRVIVAQGETRLLDLYVSQVGQVLTAATPFGYSLHADDLMFQEPGR